MKTLSKKSKKQVSVNMDLSTVKRLEKLAAEEKRSLSAQVVFILERGLTNLSEEEKSAIGEEFFISEEV